MPIVDRPRSEPPHPREYTFLYRGAALFMVGAVLFGGCGDEGATGGGGSGGDGAGATGGQGGTQTTASNSGGTSTVTESTTASGGAGGSGGQAGDTPPTEKNALFQWLKDGNYQSYTPESGPHASAGPHGGKVRTFVNPTLLASLQAGNATHPKGSSAVKELYGNGTTVSGFAVTVKTADESAAGQGWYWYETYNLNDPSSVVAAKNGVPLCVNCHVGGADFVLSPFPLQ